MASLCFAHPDQLAQQLLSTPTADLLSVIDTWCAEHPGCVSPLGVRDTDPLDREELETAAREGRPAFLFIDDEPLPPPHADVWIYGDPVVVRANARAIPRLRVLTANADAPGVFPAVFRDGSHDQLGRHDHLRAAGWLVRALRDRARTYEAVVRAIVELRPLIATVHEPRAVAPVPLAAVAARSKLDVDLVRRCAAALRFQTPVVVVAIALDHDRLAFRRS